MKEGALACFAACASLALAAACGPPPLPPQDDSRVITPVASRTPEACVQSFWALTDAGDALGASAFVSDARRTTFVESRRWYRDTERGRLRDAVGRKFGPAAGSDIRPMFEPNERHDSAQSVSIRRVVRRRRTAGPHRERRTGRGSGPAARGEARTPRHRSAHRRR